MDETASDDRQWREMFDPDIHNLINSHSGPLPTQLWRPQDLHNAEVLSKFNIIDSSDLPNGNEDEQAARKQAMANMMASLNFDTFNFLLWSKVKFSETSILAVGAKASKATTGDADAKAAAEHVAIDDELVQAFKKRFEKSLPLNSLNLIFIQSESCLKSARESMLTQARAGS